MYRQTTSIDAFDPELAKAIAAEVQRQEDHVELIASENYASPRVMAAQGSVLTNKYAEGYPGKRYYGGLHVDTQTVLLGHRIVEPDAFDEAAVAAIARVGGDDVVKRAFLGTTACETDHNHD